MEVDCEKFIAECRAEAVRQKEPEAQNREYPSDHMIREAESAKACMYKLPGNAYNAVLEKDPVLPESASSQAMDEAYMVIGGHIDCNLQQKIIDFEYVDFARLLPRDKITKIDDHGFELVMKGGSTYFAPIADRDSTSIVNFSHWEQAFRIYSNILTRAYPAKASELIQYNHVIYTAALTFSWENVYQYDREFRMHISKFPQRSWAVILQQAWSMFSKDRVKEDSKTIGGKQFSKFKGEPCRWFNKGKCSYGANCHYDHRCAVKKSGKFGHGTHICRLRDREDGTTGNSNSSGGSSSHSYDRKRESDKRT